MSRTRPRARGGIDLSQEAGLTEAWRRHAAELYGYAVTSLRDRTEADEALQETFLRAWRFAGTYDPDRPLRPWLFAILRRVIIDVRRARSHRQRVDGALEQARQEVAEETVAEVDEVLDHWVLQEALARIREDQRLILVETYYRGRPYAELAAELGIPESTARTRAFYGLKALRLALEEMGWGR